jgi:hypothetical protein
MACQKIIVFQTQQKVMATTWRMSAISKYLARPGSWVSLVQNPSGAPTVQINEFRRPVGSVSAPSLRSLRLCSECIWVCLSQAQRSRRLCRLERRGGASHFAFLLPIFLQSPLPKRSPQRHRNKTNNRNVKLRAFAPFA